MGVAEKSSGAPLPAKLAGLLREAKWLVLIALAAYLLLILATYRRSDPGWSHSATGASIANANTTNGIQIGANGTLKVDVATLEELTAAFAERPVFATAPFCATPECEEAVKGAVHALTVRVLRADRPGGGAPCVGCGEPAEFSALLARSY